jgi:uncharacterized membrane protein YhaH (DUF805 family)
MASMLIPYTKYADFTGRARRSEFWMFYLFMFVVGIVFMVGFFGAAAASGGNSSLGVISGLFALLYAIFALGSFIPYLAVAVRRLHDTNRSGAWVFITFVPLIGPFVLLIFLILEGTAGPNTYGADPKGVY